MKRRSTTTKGDHPVTTEKTNPIPAMLRQEISQWTRLGHHSLLQRYLLARATEHVSQPLPKKYARGQKRECYRNAIKLAKRYPKVLRYAEGYGFSNGTPILIHHAWAVDAENRVVDPTWDEPALSFYFGRVFTLDEWERETDRSGGMCVLDTGTGLNHVFMFADVPGLQGDVEAIAPMRKVAA
jgi:hypothetical protein